MKKRVLLETDDKTFLRDTSSMGLINNDRAAFAHYKLKREKGTKVQELCAEVSNLKQDMSTRRRQYILSVIVEWPRFWWTNWFKYKINILHPKPW